MSNLLEDEETVQLNIEVDSWESSIREAGKLLEKAHYISCLLYTSDAADD